MGDPKLTPWDLHRALKQIDLSDPFNQIRGRVEQATGLPIHQVRDLLGNNNDFVNYDRNRRQFESATGLTVGEATSKISYYKLEESMADGRRAEELRNRQNTGNSSVPKRFDPCYLTTACVSTLGLPDDCIELETLRRLRDRVLLPTREGKRVVEQYYDEAPGIVAGISKDPQAAGVWRAAYGDIATAVRMVLSGDYNGAFRHYQQMAERLRCDFS